MVAIPVKHPASSCNTGRGHPLILFVNAPSSRTVYKEDRCQIDANDVVARFFRPPVSLMILAGVAERAGYTSRILDCPAHKISFHDLRELIEHDRPGFVVVNTSEQTTKEDMLTLRISKIAKAKTIVFGYHATVMRGELLDRYPWIDMVITREPEMTLVEILENKPPATILGLSYREPSGIMKENPDRPFILDLDMLPFGSHHLVNFKKYWNPLTGKPFTVIQVSRGCPFACKFCLAKYMNGVEFRTRSVTMVLDEIEHVVRTHGVTTFFLRADTFTIQARWIESLCTGILARGLTIDWFTNSRIDTLRSRLIPLMSRAGCRIIGIGMESGIPRHQVQIGKHIQVRGIKEKIDLLRVNGIISVVYFLIGQPFDSVKTIRYNISYSKHINPTFVEFTRYVDFEGIELHPLSRAPSLSPATLKTLGKKGEISFYVRPRKIVELLVLIEKGVLLNASRAFYILYYCMQYIKRIFFQ